jgi:serine/alanine adding enzyme
VRPTESSTVHRTDKTSGLRVVRQLDQATWREFVDQEPTGNIFHSPEMFEAFLRTDGYRPNLWAAVDAESHPLALFVPVEIRLVRGPLRYLTTRAVAYGSVVCKRDQRGQGALAVLLHRYSREVERSVLFTELRNMADMQDVQHVLVNRGFEFQEHVNFLIDLTCSPDEIWARIRSNARRNIRKAEKLNVHVREANDMADIDRAYSVLVQAYNRLRVPLPPASLFRAAFEILAPVNMMRVLLASVEGVTVGALTLLLHKRVALYWYTGILRQHATYRPADLLAWRGLQLSRELGMQTFDFGGAGIPQRDYGVRDFKAKFGGNLVNFGRNTRIHAPIRFDLGQAAYRAWRRV